MSDQDFFFDEVISEKILHKDLGVGPLIAGAFDFFEIKDIINKLIGKVGSHVKINSADILQIMVTQLLSAPYQSLNGTEDFFKNLPFQCWVNDATIKAEHLNRSTLARFLDDVHEYGPEKLFLKLSYRIATALGLKVEELHIDSTSFHYDGKSIAEEDAPLLLHGYSRDHRRDLIQINNIGLCDGISKLMLFNKSVSGNENDNKSFLRIANQGLPLLREQFKELKYFVGDSALCTPDILDSIVAQGLHAVTRIPDKIKEVRNAFKDNVEVDDTFEIIYKDDEENSPKGKWIADITIGNQRMKCAIITSEGRRSSKEKSVNKAAEKEKAKLEAKLNKLRTNPCKCEDDARAEVEKLIKSAKYCQIKDITYTPKMVNAKRGRPPKGVEVSKVLNGVAVTATVTIDKELVQKKINSELKFVLATTDTERNWTIAELLSIYRRQSVIERGWRCCKSPKIMVNSIYLQKSSRIEALMWLMMVALLIYSACEYKIRQVMAKHNLTIPGKGTKPKQNQPSMLALLEYISNMRLSLVKYADKLIVDGLEQPLKDLLNELGLKWCRYFLSKTYRPYQVPLFGS